MKTIKSRLILAALAMSVCASSAYAQAPNANAQPDHAQMAEQMQKRMHDRMQERMNKHRSMMHDKLKITPEQEAAWKTFVDATAHNMKGMMGNHAERQAEHKAAESMSAPAMMEKQIERSKEHLAMMQKHVEALKTFYAVLTPEQQKTFDHLHKRMHHRAKMMRMMGRDRGHGQHDMDHTMPKK